MALPHTDRRLTLLLLVATLGCRTPAVHHTGCGPSPASRHLALARQLTVDTAIETVHHPVESVRTVLSCPPTLVHTLGQELIGNRLVLQLAKAPGPIRCDREPLDPAALDVELNRLTGTSLEPASVELFPDGSGALGALLRVIDEAEQQIDILMFMWDSDPVGELIADRLVTRAAAGIRVRVLVDGGGNLIHGAGPTVRDVNRAVCRLARSPGVEVLRTRNPFGCFDHRKLVLADGRIAWTGGRNFTYTSFFAQRDLSFTLAGPLACRLTAMFEDFWRDQGGRPGCGLPCPSPPAEPDGFARVVGTEPNRRYLANSLYRALDRAQHHIYLENVYFSDPWVVAKLAKARRRGVDVRVLLTVESDHDVVDRSNRVTANRLHKAGIRVYLHPGMLHTKAAVVDGQWGYMGTGNFDALSLRQDRELGLAIGAGPLVSRLEEVLATGHRPEWEMKEPLSVTAHDQIAAFIAALFL